MQNKRKFWLLILVLTLGIMGVERIYQEGAIFLLDYVSYPVEMLSVSFWKNPLSHFMFEWGMWLFGYMRFSKLFFFAVIFASGRLGYQLTQIIIKLFDLPWAYQTPLLICGILLLLINPVLYERMITQPGVYAAIVLLGYGLLFLLKTLTSVKLSHFARAGLFWGLSMSFSAHTVFFSAGVSLLYLFCFFPGFWAGQLSKIKKIWLGFLVLAVVTILPNLNWLIGGFLGSGAIVTDAISTFNQANIEAFLSNTIPPLNLELTNLTLRGFWGERYWHFILPDEINPLRWIFSLFLLVCSVFGYVLHFAQHRQKVLYLIAIALLAWILGCGISSNWFWVLNQWIYDHVPFYIGLREPQKWIGLLLFPRAIGIILLMSQLLSLLDELWPNQMPKSKKIWSLILLFAVLVANTPMLFGAFGGQLSLSSYPQDYHHYKTNYLSSDLQKGKILILPWHSYIRCGWNDRVIANPMKAYLWSDTRIISSDNIEIANLYTNSSSQQSQDVESFLHSGDLSLLRAHGIATIVMMEQCADYQRYSFLSGMQGLAPNYQSTTLSTYHIE